MIQIVGIGGYAVSNRATDIIKTYALSSCVAVTAYSPVRNAAGMIHAALPCPLSLAHRPRNHPPAYFATSGVPFLMARMVAQFGCSLNELQIHVFGGANSLRNDDHFRIGLRNLKAVAAVLEDMKLSYSLSDVGGQLSRSVELEVGSGAIYVVRQPMAV